MLTDISTFAILLLSNIFVSGIRNAVGISIIQCPLRIATLTAVTQTIHNVLFRVDRSGFLCLAPIFDGGNSGDGVVTRYN